MTKIEQLRALRGRVAKLAGPDREADRDVAKALCEQMTNGYYYSTINQGDVSAYFSDGAPQVLAVPSPFLTSSIDAVEALRHRLLPGTWCRSQVLRDCCTSQSATPDGWMHTSTAPTEALARMLALLDALIAQGEE